MMDVTSAELEKLVNVSSLADWLDRNIPELGKGRPNVELLHGGTSNVVLAVDRGGESMVLRRPPAVPPPGAERGVLREARVLTALNGTDVPHPFCYGACEDSEVIGAPFYVMQRVNGWAPNLRDERIYNVAPFDKMPFEYGIYHAVVDGLVQLANVDYEAVGLADFGKPHNFLERQVDRWAHQLASYRELYGYAGRHIEGYDELEAWLRANSRKTDVIGIIHGDVGTPNMMFQYGPPARLAAMIDWELSTIGDPMVDIGWFCGGLRDERFPDMIMGSDLSDPFNAPTRQELARYYCAGTGRNIDDLDFYCLLASFKLGCILEYKVAQAEAGILPEQVGTFFRKSVDATFKRCAETIRRIS